MAVVESLAAVAVVDRWGTYAGLRPSVSQLVQVLLGVICDLRAQRLVYSCWK